jgi:polyhydroxybutyrate depolymerase
MFAYKLGRELSDKIAAIAPIEGCMYPGDKDTLNPISVIAFHGTRDPVIPHEGGTGRWLGIKLKVPSVAETIEFWTKHNGCESAPERESTNNITRELFKNGKDNTEVCLYTLTGGGHIWPGGRRALLTGHNSERDLSATEKMCQFFWTHPKKIANELDNVKSSGS